MTRSISVLCAALPFVLSSCGGSQPAAESGASAAESPPAASPVASSSESSAKAEAPAPAAEPKKLSFELEAKSGSKVTGKVTLTEEASGVKLVLEIAGATPGDHGAHIHETPDCSAPDAKSAGSHYNPDKHQHGLPDAPEKHLGDLGNLVVGKDGKGTLEMSIPGANLKANDPHSFLGRAVIVHEKKDDGGQPVGNAGGRIACAALVEK